MMHIIGNENVCTECELPEKFVKKYPNCVGKVKGPKEENKLKVELLICYKVTYKRNPDKDDKYREGVHETVFSDTQMVNEGDYLKDKVETLRIYMKDRLIKELDTEYTLKDLSILAVSILSGRVKEPFF